MNSWCDFFSGATSFLSSLNVRQIFCSNRKIVVVVLRIKRKRTRLYVRFFGRKSDDTQLSIVRESSHISAFWTDFKVNGGSFWSLEMKLSRPYKDFIWCGSCIIYFGQTKRVRVIWLLSPTSSMNVTFIILVFRTNWWLYILLLRFF